MNTEQNRARPTAATLARHFKNTLQQSLHGGNNGISFANATLLNGSISTVSTGYAVDMAELSFLTMEGLDQIHYISMRHAWCEAYSYTHDEYGDMPVGQVIELVLEIKIDLSALTVTACHCRGGAEQSTDVHSYPMLKELGCMLGEVLNQIPQLKWLLRYLGGDIPQRDIANRFDQAEWEVEAILEKLPEWPQHYTTYCG